MINLYERSNVIQKIIAIWVSWDVNRNISRVESYFSSKKKMADTLTMGWKQLPRTWKAKIPREMLIPHLDFLFERMTSSASHAASAEQSLTRLAESLVGKLIEAYAEGYEDPKKANLAGFFPRLTPEFSSLLDTNLFQLSTGALESINKRNFGPLDKLIRLVELCTIDTRTEFNLPAVLNKRRQHFFQPRAKHYLAHLWSITKFSISDIRQFCGDYGITFIRDGEVRAFYNLANLYLHIFVLHGRAHVTQMEKDLCLCAAILHPIQDDYVDGNNVSEEHMHALENLLKGDLNTKAPVVELNGIFSIVKKIYDTLPPQKNPRLVEIFCELQKWQIISIDQKQGKALSDDRLLEISFMKGGWAFAFYGYMALKRMSSHQFIHFFVMGAIFQIMDDLHDIDDDLNDGIDTVWTREISRSHHVDRVLGAFLLVQSYFEQSTNTENVFSYPALARFIEIFGSRYDTFRFYCMQRKYFSVEARMNIENQFDIDIDMAISFFSHTKEHENLDIYLSIVEQLKEKIAVACQSSP